MNMKNVKARSAGRNKPVRAIARTGVSGGRLPDFAGNATARYAWVALFRPTMFLSGMLNDIILEAAR
ncbi:hypothetical protein [Methylobacter tundripaludum]|uniref:hypothetical protein n=1 Tax=Methylobacter tundripaludum TaxID=173365 RepID=UPI0004DED0EC|nr:hypothetical protein [Methylobacter tundripaludum]